MSSMEGVYTYSSPLFSSFFLVSSNQLRSPLHPPFNRLIDTRKKRENREDSGSYLHLAYLAFHVPFIAVTSIDLPDALDTANPNSNGSHSWMGCPLVSTSYLPFRRPINEYSLLGEIRQWDRTAPIPLACGPFSVHKEALFRGIGNTLTIAADPNTTTSLNACHTHPGSPPRIRKRGVPDCGP